MNYYELLGIAVTATDTEIKSAYRKLSLHYHPDRHTSNKEEMTNKFQSIGMAYEILSDQLKKKEYDISIGLFVQPNPMELPVKQNNSGGIRIYPSSIITQEQQIKHNYLIDSICQTCTISLEQAYSGGSIPITITRTITTITFSLLMEKTCETETETIYVPIPQGIDNNEYIQLMEKGHVLQIVGEPIKRGDIKIKMVIENNTPFTRNGLDLIMHRTISLKEALLGIMIEFTHISGRLIGMKTTDKTIIVPEMVKTIPIMGMIREGITGNLQIIFHVVFPEYLTDEQIKGLQCLL